MILALLAGYYVLRSLRGVLGFGGYVISFVALFAVCVPLLLWRTLKNMPEGTGVTGEKSSLIDVPFDRLNSIIPLIIEKCRWKLAIADAERGYFKGKIGRSIQTMYGQIFQIDVKKMNEASSEIHVRCEAYHQIVDYGQNRKMIDKFYNQLYQTCLPPETPPPSTTHYSTSRGEQATVKLQHKDARFAALISGVGGIFTFGLGHLYVGRIGRGVALFFLGSLLKMGLGWLYYLRGGVGLIVIFGIVNVGLWIWQTYDAYALAKKYNTEVERTGTAPW